MMKNLFAITAIAIVFLIPNVVFAETEFSGTISAQNLEESIEYGIIEEKIPRMNPEANTNSPIVYIDATKDESVKETYESESIYDGEAFYFQMIEQIELVLEKISTLSSNEIFGNPLIFLFIVMMICIVGIAIAKRETNPFPKEKSKKHASRQSQHDAVHSSGQSQHDAVHSSGQSQHDDEPDNFSEALGKLGEKIHYDYGESFNKHSPKIPPKYRIEEPHASQKSKPKVETDPREKPKSSSTLNPSKSHTFSNEIETILYSKDPHLVLGVSKNASWDEIRAKYKEYSKKYDPSKGSIKKSSIENQRANTIMKKINLAYLQLKRINRG